jgi:succinoglycan biosynthesis transport protein ExoP
MECARALYRRKRTLLLIASFGVLIAVLISVVQPHIYQSQASIQIQGVNENFLNLREISPTAAPGADNAVYVQTQAEMLQQDALIEQVVGKLHLEDRKEFRRGPGLWDRFRRGGSGVSSSAPARWSVVESVKKNLQIAPSRGSSIIQIVCDARDPQVAADVANTLAQTFIEQSIQARQRAARQTRDSLSLELEELRRKLHKSEAELGEYGGGSVSPTMYGVLKREVDGSRQFYEAMSRRVDEATVASVVP